MVFFVTSCQVYKKNFPGEIRGTIQSKFIFGPQMQNYGTY